MEKAHLLMILAVLTQSGKSSRTNSSVLVWQELHSRGERRKESIRVRLAILNHFNVMLVAFLSNYANTVAKEQTMRINFKQVCDST